MVKVEVGEKVMFADGYGRDRKYRPGTVVKAGRVWIEVRPDDTVGNGTFRFRLDDQTDGSKYGDAPRFYTLAQWTEHQRVTAAWEFLDAQGIDVRRGSPWSDRVAELADLIRPAADPAAAPAPAIVVTTPGSA